MKYYPPKIIRNYIRYLGLVLFIFIPLFLFVHIPRSFDSYEKDEILFTLFLFVLLIGSLSLFYVAFLNKLFSHLFIQNEVVTWKCPFYKSISISLSDCDEIGLEYEDAYIKNVYAYIYFASNPYSPETSKYYGKVICKNGLIKFRYTNELAKYLMENYPNKTSFQLCKYYREHRNDN